LLDLLAHADRDLGTIETAVVDRLVAAQPAA
jgi:hypothetical protein